MAVPPASTAARGAAPLVLLALLAACTPAPDAAAGTGPDGAGGTGAGADGAPAADAASPPQQFWANLAEQCGAAYPGRLVLEPPGDDMLTGTEELIVHFRSCTDQRLELPFHIEVEATGDWDRSRTWIYTRHADNLELRHDHRHEDGTQHDNNLYGAHTQHAGTATRQEFILTERTAPDGSPLGWRVEIEPGARYTYGTIRGGEWTWRVDFDLSRTVPTPPAPWGWQ